MVIGKRTVPWYFRKAEKFETIKDFLNTIDHRFNAILSSFVDLTTTEMENPAKIILQYSTHARVKGYFGETDETDLIRLDSWENNIHFPEALVTLLFKDPRHSQKIISLLLKKQIFGAITFTWPVCEKEQKQEIASQIAEYFCSSPKLNFVYFEECLKGDVNFTEICKSLKYLSNLEVLDLYAIKPKEEKHFCIHLSQSMLHLKKLRQFSLCYSHVSYQNCKKIFNSLISMDQKFEFLFLNGSCHPDSSDSEDEMWDLYDKLENKCDILETR